MKPSPHLLLLLAIWVILGLLTAVAGVIDWQKTIELKFVFWAYAVVLGIVTLLDYLVTQYTRPNLKITRTVDPHLALGVRQKVTIKVSNRSDRSPAIAEDAPRRWR